MSGEQEAEVGVLVDVDDASPDLDAHRSGCGDNLDERTPPRAGGRGVGQLPPPPRKGVRIEAAGPRECTNAELRVFEVVEDAANPGPRRIPV